MRAKVPLTICYLGRRGGGAKITSQIYQDLKNSETFSTVAICIRSDNELAKEYDQSKQIFLFENLLSIKTLAKVKSKITNIDLGLISDLFMNECVFMYSVYHTVFRKQQVFSILFIYW